MLSSEDKIAQAINIQTIAQINIALMEKCMALLDYKNATEFAKILTQISKGISEQKED